MEENYDISVTITVPHSFIGELAHQLAWEIGKQGGVIGDIPPADGPRTVGSVVKGLAKSNAEAAALIEDLGLTPAISDDQMKAALIKAGEGVEGFKDKGFAYLRLFAESHKNPDGSTPMWHSVTRDVPRDLRDTYLAGFYGFLGKTWEGVEALPADQIQQQ